MPSIIVYLLIAAGALTAAFGVGYHYGNKPYVRLQAAVIADNEARKLALKNREAEDTENAKRIQRNQERDLLAQQAAAARITALEADAKRLFAQLRRSRLDLAACILPDDVQRMLDAAERSGSRPPPGGADAGASPPPAARAQLDCLKASEIAVDRTLMASYNADALDACWTEAIRRWELRTGRRFDWSTSPWLRPPTD